MASLGKSLTYALLALLSALPSYAALPCLGDADASERYTVYLIPRLPSTQLFENWGPLLRRVGAESGLCFDLVIPQSFDAFETAMMKGKPDFSYLNPYHQVMVHETQGYIPLVRNRTASLAGIIVVPQESGIRELKQLDGKTVAFPSPNAYVASLITRAKLAQEGIAITPLYVGSHSNVYRAVVRDMAAAGGGANTTFGREPETLRNRLRLLYTSEFYTPHPFSAHPRVPEAVQERVRRSFLKLHDDPEGAAMLKAIQMPEPVGADYRRDYKVLESLRLERFVTRRRE